MTHSACNGVPTANTASLEVQSMLSSARTCHSAQKKKSQPAHQRHGDVAGWGGEGVASESPLPIAIILFLCLGENPQERKCWKQMQEEKSVWVFMPSAACFTMLTGGNETMHSRKLTMRPEGGRKGCREKTVRGSNEVFCSKSPSLQTDFSRGGCLCAWCMKRQFQDELVF